MGKDWKKCKMAKIGHSELFWTTLVAKDGGKCDTMKIGHSKSFWTTLVEKDWKKGRMTNDGVISGSKDLSITFKVSYWSIN